MINPEDIEPGTSYACRFRVNTFVTAEGTVRDTRKLKPGETVKDAQPGTYEGFGVIQKRDTAKRLFEIWDQANDRTWVVDWHNTWDIDTVEWVDNSVE